MTNQDSMHKTFVKQDDQAMIVCPACGSARSLSVGKFRHRQHEIKVKCKCGHAFNLQLEFRSNFRKDTDLEGIYDLNPPGKGSAKITVVNLSLSGASFEVSGENDLKVGQTGSMVFTLDNRKATVLFKRVVIKSINGSRIGCEFEEDQAFQKDLGFYLLP